MSCRFCAKPLEHSFCDLGAMPLANSYLSKEQLQQKEALYPLHVYFCKSCGLVQLKEHQPPEKLFSEYAYRSACSDTWCKHVEDFAKEAIERFELVINSHVIEIGSNDGYLLQFFDSCSISVLGIDPAANIATKVPTLNRFFNAELAAELKKGDLIIGNNVLAHVPDINDFIKGLKLSLKPKGVVSLEFPHLLQLIQNNQFDTIYHEHVFYFSLKALDKIFKKHKLTIFDAEEIPTHGGSLRIYAKHDENKLQPILTSVKKVKEKEAGLDLKNFAMQTQESKRKIVELLMQLKREGKKVVGYGAPAKGTVLLNYCGIGPDLLAYTVDKNPHKQGRFIAGCRIPIEKPEAILTTKPDYIFILPWNLKEEIMMQLKQVRTWGGKFIVPIPEPEVIT